MGGQRTTPAALPQRKTDCIGGWVVRRGTENPPPPTQTKLHSRTFQPVASGYTDWAIPAHKGGEVEKKVKCHWNGCDQQNARCNVVW